jgi:hypothetical protein
VTSGSVHISDHGRAAMELQAVASEAVSVLGIGPDIERMSPTLFAQIEDCDTFATTSGDTLFLATSLPIANAFIHYATSLDALNRARRWARERWPDEDDPTSMLAVLTLMYIVSAGLSRYKSDPQKSAVWERIDRRIENTLHTEPAAAVA